MAKNNIYGTNTPQLKNIAVDRLGVVTMSMSQKCNYTVDTIWSVIQQQATIHAAPAINLNIPCVGLNTPTLGNGTIEFSYGYEGFNGDVTASEVIYELEGADNHEPIESHPAFRDLFKKYGGVAGTDGSPLAFFPALAPAGVDGPLNSDGKMQNPMSGVDSFLSVGWTWRRTRLALNIDSDVYQRAGYIDTPPGSGQQQPPQLPNSRNWVKLAPRTRWRGNCWEIVESWLASGRNGFVKDMYTAPSNTTPDAGGGGGDGGGLTTGGLTT